MFDSRVTRVLTEDGRAAGVELADGTQIRSKMVVSDINAGKPDMMRFGWTGGGGHMLDIYAEVVAGSARKD